MKNTWLTKFQAIVGLLLVAIPLFAPVFFSIIRLISIGKFQIDYLMPAELGLSVFFGAGLLIWASIRSHAFLKWIAWCLGMAIVFIFGGQGFAVLAGLSTDKIEATGWQFKIVFATIIGYDFAILGLIIGGILLCKFLFQIK